MNLYYEQLYGLLKDASLFFMKTRRCETPLCRAFVTPGSRERFCRPCAAQRIRDSNARAAADRAAGITRPRANASKTRQSATAWVCAYLLAHPCACGEARIHMLEFIQADGQRSAVDRAVTANVPLEAIQATVATSTVTCHACWTLTQVLSRPAYRLTYRLAAILDQQRQSGRQPPGGTVLPPAPQPQEGGGAASVELQVEAPGPADLPPRDDRVEAVPHEPADGAPQVDVGDDAAAMALGDPVGEAGGGRGHDNAVDAGQERRLERDGGDGGVVGGVRFVRRPRQR